MPREKNAVYCGNRRQHTSKLCGQNAQFGMLKQVAAHTETLGLIRLQFIKLFHVTRYYSQMNNVNK
jgi:hypothetical protein